jgi:ParB family transcriptional regulator, chromosome partitioning protein
MGFAHLIDEYGLTQDDVAERIGKSRPAVANALRLLSLSDSIKAKLRQRLISFGHARALLGLDAAMREAIAERIVRDGLSVRDVERLGERRAKKSAATQPAKSPDILAVESRLRYALAAPVAVIGGARGGRIEVRYADAADLNRLLDAIAPER